VFYDWSLERRGVRGIETRQTPSFRSKAYAHIGEFCTETQSKIIKNKKNKNVYISKFLGYKVFFSGRYVCPLSGVMERSVRRIRLTGLSDTGLANEFYNAQRDGVTHIPVSIQGAKG
jgi:hypothetical protein